MKVTGTGYGILFGILEKTISNKRLLVKLTVVTGWLVACSSVN